LIAPVQAYCDANQKFATTVMENFHDGELVWVHDYPLLLVPVQLARRHIAPVGLFLHSPFPSSEIFRSLSVRDELLRSMLSADFIGFHLFEFARHFLTSCRRILGLTHTSKRGGCLSVDCQGREVSVVVTHVGIEPQFLLSKFSSTPAIVTSAAEWRRLFPGCCIFAGIDSIERLKGISLKLAAIQAFLEAYPSFIGRIVLVQICIESTVRPGDTQQPSLHEIRALTDRINTRFGSAGRPTVHLVFRSSVPLAERLALWAATDCYVNTAIRDGLNVLPFGALLVWSFICTVAIA
jgi:trehalose 6-phosphate synthase/phosphatase